MRGCKYLEDTTPLLRLKKYLFCKYDSTVRPNHHEIVTNVSLRLMPKMMEYVSKPLKEIVIRKMSHAINKVKDI